MKNDKNQRQLEMEEARKKTLAEAEEFAQMMNSPSFPTFLKQINLRIKNCIELWLSEAGESDNLCQKMRAEINLLRDLRDTPKNFVLAGENALRAKDNDEND